MDVQATWRDARIRWPVRPIEGVFSDARLCRTCGWVTHARESAGCLSCRASTDSADPVRAIRLRLPSTVALQVFSERTTSAEAFAQFARCADKSEREILRFVERYGGLPFCAHGNVGEDRNTCVQRGNASYCTELSWTPLELYADEARVLRSAVHVAKYLAKEEMPPSFWREDVVTWLLSYRPVPDDATDVNLARVALMELAEVWLNRANLHWNVVAEPLWVDPGRAGQPGRPIADYRPLGAILQATTVVGALAWELLRVVTTARPSRDCAVAGCQNRVFLPNEGTRGRKPRRCREHATDAARQRRYRDRSAR